MLAERFSKEQFISTTARIIFVTDALGWVQERRLGYLKRYLPDITFLPMSAARFRILWNRGRLRDDYIYFATWRIPSGSVQAGDCSFEDADFDRFMTSVTSHYNIGGGLNPEAAVAQGRNHTEAFDTAVSWLSRFKVVTANSKILYDLLSPQVERLLYAPNGIDQNLFAPHRDRPYDPAYIRIGWVGKQKAAKNYPLIEAALDDSAKMGIEMKIVSVARDGFKKPSLIAKIANRLSSIRPPDILIAQSERVDRWANSFKRKVPYESMPLFYQGIDYYLNTSWHEGTPNPALEAASCGIPVITTRVGNMPDLIIEGENGYFIDPSMESIQFLFDRISNLTAADYNKISNSARTEILNGWTWDKQIANYREAFSRFLGTNVNRSYKIKEVKN
tara:strand:+ start:3379 stop:4548 length:1170 start_codon:yes stop_codon:yes gene_type:complete